MTISRDLSKFEESRNTDRDPSYEIALGAGERPEMLNIGRNVLLMLF